MIIAVVASIILGLMTWSFAEYALHNWYGHVAKGRNHFSREHLKHHKNGQYFAPTKEKAAAATIAFALVFPLAYWLAGALYGTVYSLSFAAMYLFYEWLHRRCHTHAPKSAYGRWVRKHHLHHHYTRPKENHGVTSAIWDFIFRTATPTQIVRVPERKIFEVPWLVDEEGDVWPEFADDYVIARANR